MSLVLAIVLIAAACAPNYIEQQEQASLYEPPYEPVPEDIASEISEAWQNSLLCLTRPIDNLFVYVVCAPANSPALDKYPQLFGMEPIAVLSDPDADDAVLFSFGLRYSGAIVHIYSLSGDNDGSVHPSRLPCEPVLAVPVESDRFTVLISGFSNTE